MGISFTSTTHFPAASIAWPAFLALVLTLLSGVGDAYGFVHAARIWRADVISWPEVGRSSLGFVFGTSMQWLAIRYQQRLGITVAELQTIVSFAVTMIGIALLSGSALEWAVSERLVALGVLFGLGWLIVRTAG